MKSFARTPVQLYGVSLSVLTNGTTLARSTYWLSGALALVQGPDAANQYARRLIEGLRVTMFAIGAATVGALRGTNRLRAS